MRKTTFGNVVPEPGLTQVIGAPGDTYRAPRAPATWVGWAKELIAVVLLVLIAAAFFAIVLRGSFRPSLIYSASVGLAIYFLATAIDLRRGYFEWKTALVAVPLGGAAGVVFAGFFTGKDSWLFAPEASHLLPLSLAGAGLFGAAGAYWFYSRITLGERAHALGEERFRRVANEQKLGEAELRLLQAQIEPHFLFNTLNNILSMLDEGETAQARAMLACFTTYLRASLQHSRSDSATLGDELALLRAYLEIQKMRMGDRLEYEFDAPAQTLSIEIPPLLLQPLVENAVRHGLESCPGPGRVLVKAAASGQALCVEVRDTGVGMRKQSPPGVGLSNVYERLQVRYGNRASLVIQANEPQGVCARLTVPLTC